MWLQGQTDLAKNLDTPARLVRERTSLAGPAQPTVPAKVRCGQDVRRGLGLITGLDACRPHQAQHYSAGLSPDCWQRAGVR